MGEFLVAWVDESEQARRTRRVEAREPELAAAKVAADLRPTPTGHVVYAVSLKDRPQPVVRFTI